MVLRLTIEKKLAAMSQSKSKDEPKDRNASESVWSVDGCVVIQDGEDPGRSTGSFLQTIDHVVDPEPDFRQLIGVGQVLDVPDSVRCEDDVGFELPALAAIDGDDVDREADDLPVVTPVTIK